jgi:hypothetical protein
VQARAAVHAPQCANGRLCPPAPVRAADMGVREADMGARYHPAYGSPQG